MDNFLHTKGEVKLFCKLQAANLNPEFYHCKCGWVMSIKNKELGSIPVMCYDLVVL